jgi:alpha-1,2-mannosyltransferase
MIQEPFSPAGAAWLRLPIFKEALPLVLTPVLLVGWWYRYSLPRALRRAYLALLGLVILAFGTLCLSRAAHNVEQPPQWDVESFWLFGKVAVAGYDFYLPSSFYAVADSLRAAGQPVSSDDEFRQMVLDPAVPYPPVTMLAFAPLGAFDLHTGALVWYAALVVALVAVVLLLWRTFFETSGWWGLAFTAAMVLTLRPIYSTFAFGQTSLFLLIALLLFWRNRDRIPGGVYLALAMSVKPIGAFFVSFPLAVRQWRPVLATILAIVALVGVTALAFGTEVLTTFVTTDLVDRLPETVFTTHVNQSLLGILVRATEHDASSGSPLWNPAFLAMSFAIVTLTFALAVRLGSARSSLAIALGVPAALLAYPQTLEHYGVLLLIPILFLWTHQKALGVSPVAAILFLTAEYALVRADEGGLAFFGFALCWLTFVAIAVRVIRHPAASVPTPRATRATRDTTAVPSRVTIPPGAGLPPRATVPPRVTVP